MKCLVSLSLTISDTAVSAAIVARDCGDKKIKPQDIRKIKPVIVTYRNTSFNPGYEELTAANLEKRISSLISNCIKDARYSDLVKSGYTVKDITQVYVSLSAPWFDGKTVLSHFEEPKAFKVTPQILEKALDSELKAISGFDRDHITILESNILSATLNGYAINQPVGKMANSLSLSGYVSYARASFVHFIENAIHAHFPHISDILIKSEPTILLSAAKREVQLKNLNQDFAIIRVNEVITHIQIVRNGLLYELGTIPIGMHAILDKISNEYAATYDAANNLLSLYFEKKLDVMHLAKIEPILKGALEKWKKAIRDFSVQSLASGRFPSYVFLSSPSIISHILREYLLQDNYLDITMSSKELTIDILDRSSLNEFISVDTKHVKEEPGFLTKLNAMI